MTQTDALAQFDDAVYKYAHQWMRYPSIRIDFDLEDLAQIGRIYILKALEDRWHPHTEPEPETFQSMTEGLSDAAQYILELRFEDDLTLAEIGAKVGKSHEWVRQFINKTISNMEA